MCFRPLAVIAFTFYFSSVANACSIPPEHMYLSHDKTIDDAEWIARVTLKSYSEEANLYELKVVEYLKGSGPDTINIESYGSRSSSPQSTQPVQTNYFGHYNSNFWEIGGSYANGTDCKIHPDFKYGGTQYLVFGPKDYHVGYENITDENDAWLSYVREYEAGKNPKKPTEKPWDKYFNDAQAVIRIKANWSNGQPVWSQEILKGPQLNYIPMMYISPYEHFKEQFDPDCRPKYRKRKDLKSIDQLVVFEQIPKNEINMSQYLRCTGANHSNSASIRANGIYSRSAHRSYEIENGIVELINGQFLRKPRSIDWSNLTKIELDKVEAILEK